MKTINNAGFSLLEIMIVVSIIGFLAGIGLPSFMRARASAQSTRCIDNLRQINSAKDQWAVENLANDGDPVYDTDIGPYLKRGFPVCPANGTYDVTVVGNDPLCGFGGGHTI